MSASIDKLNISDDKKQYINDTLNPLLMDLVTEMLKNCPKEPATYMVEYLQKKKGIDLNDDSEEMRAENEKLRADIKTLSATLKEAGGMLANLTSENADADSDEEDDDDVCDELPEHFKKVEGKQQTARASVSAEAYGQWNQKKAFVAKKIAKTDEQKERLKNVLSKSFLFSNLDDKDFVVVIDAMEEKIFDADMQIIKQGDDGDYLFVVEQGKLECYKQIDGEDKVVKVCEPGDVFGELALLYNTQRAANVRTTGNCILWQLDRATFNAIVKDAAAAKRTRYEQFLKSVTLLKDMNAYELSQVADALKPEIYSDKQQIISQGETGDKFYIVEEGAPVAIKDDTQVMEYKAGEYFGELALLMDQPRLATVKAVGCCKVLSLDRRSFKRLLGPLDEIMRRAGVDRYK